MLFELHFINMIPWCIHVYSIRFVGTSTTPAKTTLQPSTNPVQSQGRLRSCNPVSILYHLQKNFYLRNPLIQ